MKKGPERPCFLTCEVTDQQINQRATRTDRKSGVRRAQFQ